MTAYSLTYKPTAKSRTIKAIGAYFAPDDDAAEAYARRVVDRETCGAGVVLSVERTEDPREPRDNGGMIEVVRELLSEMSVRGTRVIRGHVVTRFSANAFEIDTWGRAYYDLPKAAEVLAK
jgi:hypothetical protein